MQVDPEQLLLPMDTLIIQVDATAQLLQARMQAPQSHKLHA
jgi:hypothetical protein